jgi:hypothetical protein
LDSTVGQENHHIFSFLNHIFLIQENPVNIKRQNYLNIVAISTFILLLVALPASLVLASSSGSRDAGTGTDVADIGTVSWKNPDHITSPGSPNAFSNPIPDNGGITHYLQGTDYGFTIPTDATINGIVVEISRKSSETGSPFITDNIVRLVKGGALIGDNKAATGIDWPITFSIARYGGVSDLWGTTWTASDINESNFGAVLSVSNPNPTSFGKATVDWIRITVYYNLIDSTTTVDCEDGTPEVVYGDSITCIATVVRSSGEDTPTGTADWTTDSSGSFDPSSCVLSGSDGTATCLVNYTPGAVGTGTHHISVNYTGDSNFAESDGNVEVIVHKSTPTLSVTNSPITYDGSSHAANVEGSVPGIVSNVKYNGSATEPTDADIYAIMADFIPTDTSNYETLTDVTAGDFVIEKATPTLFVTNSPVNFDGLPHASIVESSVPGSVSNVKYDGYATEPVFPGTYAITTDFTPTDTDNYEILTDASAGDFEILGNIKYLPLIFR